MPRGDDAGDGSADERATGDGFVQVALDFVWHCGLVKKGR